MGTPLCLSRMSGGTRHEQRKCSPGELDGRDCASKLTKSRVVRLAKTRAHKLEVLGEEEAQDGNHSLEVIVAVADAVWRQLSQVGEDARSMLPSTCDRRGSRQTQAPRGHHHSKEEPRQCTFPSSLQLPPWTRNWYSRSKDVRAVGILPVLEVGNWLEKRSWEGETAKRVRQRRNLVDGAMEQ